MAASTLACNLAPRSLVPSLAGRQSPGRISSTSRHGDAVLGVREDGRPGKVGPIGADPACGDGLYDVRNDKAIPIKKTGRPELPPERAPRVEAGPDARMGRTVRRPRRPSAGSTAAGSMKGASRTPTWRSARCSRTLTGRVGGHGAASASFTSFLASRPGAAVPRPATRVERFGTNDGLPAGGVFVHDVKGVTDVLRPASRIRIVAPLRRNDAPLRARRQRSTTSSGVNYLVGGVRCRRPAGTRLPEPRAGDGGAATRSRTAPGRSTRSMFARFGTRRRSGWLLPTATSPGCSSSTAVWFDTTRRRGCEAPPAGQVLIRRVTGEPRAVIVSPAAARSHAGTQLDAASNSLRFEFAPADVPRRERHRVPVAARRPRRRLVGMDARSTARLHQPRASATTASASARATSPARSATRRPTRSRSCRRGTARGGPMAATCCSALLVRRRRSTACSAGASSPRSASARSSPKRRLRAEAAEALAQAESEGKKNVELLSEIGREITASLDFDTIFGKLYERVNQLADADVFGVGLYHPEQPRDRVPAGDREGQALRALHARHHATTNQLPVWCIEHREPVFINDLPTEYSRYITRLRRERASRSKTARCRRSRSRSSTCRSSPRTACSASSRSRASRRTPTPSTT